MKITLAQICCVAGDVEGNAAKIVEAAHKAKASSLVIFPELAVSGMCSAEMFKSPEFIARCEKALDKIAAECETVSVLVGCPVEKYNAAVYMFQGQRKVFKKKYLEDEKGDEQAIRPAVSSVVEPAAGIPHLSGGTSGLLAGE